MNDPTLATAYAEAVAHWPDRPAIQYGDEVLTYGRFGELVTHLAGAYAELGVRRGDRVVCRAGNRPEHIVAAVAAWTAGAVHVAAGPECTGPELDGYVRRTAARALVYASAEGAGDPYGPVRYVRERHPEPRIVLIGGGPVPDALDFAELVSGAAGRTPEPPRPEDPAAIFSTSGTTGTPKMPMGYHGRLHRSWTGLGAELDLTPDDTHLGHLPLAHGLGLMVLTASMVTGGRTIVVPRFSATGTLPLVANEQVSVLHGTPAHFGLLLERPAAERRDARSLRVGIASGAMFSPRMLRSIRDELGMRLMLMYGSSEGVGVSTMDPEEMLAGSVGRTPPAAVAIVDGSGGRLPPGEAGEIAFDRSVFPVRYWRPPEAGRPPGPAAEQRSGWYHTGDLGRMDDEGRPYVLGRVRDLINRGGEKVDPIEVERALLGCPGVRDAAVLGVPDRVLGQVVCACVVPAGAVTLTGLRSALSGELARYKLPERLHVMDRIPRTGLGKVDAARLRTRVLGEAS